MLSDFGKSKHEGSHTFSRMTGARTYGWVSPEVLVGLRKTSQRNPSCTLRKESLEPHLPIAKSSYNMRWLAAAANSYYGIWNDIFVATGCSCCSRPLFVVLTLAQIESRSCETCVCVIASHPLCTCYCVALIATWAFGESNQGKTGCSRWTSSAQKWQKRTLPRAITTRTFEHLIPPPLNHDWDL